MVLAAGGGARRGGGVRPALRSMAAVRAAAAPPAPWAPTPAAGGDVTSASQVSRSPGGATHTHSHTPHYTAVAGRGDTNTQPCAGTYCHGRQHDAVTVGRPRPGAAARDGGRAARAGAQRPSRPRAGPGRAPHPGAPSAPLSTFSCNSSAALPQPWPEPPGPTAAGAGRWRWQCRARARGAGRLRGDGGRAGAGGAPRRRGR